MLSQLPHKYLDQIKSHYPDGGPDAWEELYNIISILTENDELTHVISLKIYDILFDLLPIE